MSRRDNFTKLTIDTLAKRVAYLCSNPDCRKVTVGPSSKSTSTINTGVAAHITAAAPGGKRYDPNLTKEERKGIDNGIWLCQTCAKLIDSDEQQYTIDLLRNWKIEAENSAMRNIEGGYSFYSYKLDRTIFAQSTLIDQLGEMLSNDADKTIEILRNTWREGYKERAENQLKVLKSDSKKWNILSNKVKSKILRFEAGLLLDNEDGLSEAKNLADQAYDLDPSDEGQSKIRALIARQENDLIRAIGYLKSKTDVDSLNMLAAFFLEAGNTSKCEETLYRIDLAVANAETYRLRALLFLFKRDIKQSRENIRKAEEISPNWYVIKFNRAMIDFYSVIANALLPNRPILWPEPFTPDVVKRDKESIAHLQNATRLFEELAKYENSGIDSEILRNWKLACRLVNSAKQDGISELIRDNLKSNPVDYYLIIWALELNYEFDFEAAENAIREITLSNKVTIFHVITLAGLLLRREAWKEAENILDSKYELFKAQASEPLWLFWKVQLLGIQGEFEEAHSILSQAQPDQSLAHLKGMLLSFEVQKTKNKATFLHYLEEQFADTKDPLFLLQLCKIRFSEHDWKFVVSNARALINYFQTAEILRFTLVAIFNSHEYRLCLDLLEENQHMFGDDLPGDIRRLKAICLREQGLLNAAIAEMESLPMQSTQGLFQMAQMYLQQGDLKKFTLIGRELAEKSDLAPVEALQLAHYLRQEDPELAKVLFKKAEEGDIPTSYLGGLLLTALKLGLDNETKPIRDLINQSSPEETGLNLISFEELKRFIAKENQVAQEIQSLFLEGNIPVHLFAQNRNINLAYLYHHLLGFNEKDSKSSEKPLVLIRHGGRLIYEQIQNLSNTYLYVDIVSLLLTEHFGILKYIEDAVSVIKIPDEAIVSLVEMRDQLLPHQPLRINYTELLLDLVEQNKISVLETGSRTVSNQEESNFDILIKLSRDNHGKIVALKNTLKEKQDYYNSAQLFISARTLIDALLREGKISSIKYEEIIDQLGDEGFNDEVDYGFLTLKTPIYFWGNTIDIFAGIGILEMICDHFKVHIQFDLFHQKKEEIQYYKYNERTAKWLSGLIERLRLGIAKDKYQLMGVVNVDTDTRWDFDPFGNLRALFTFQKNEKALILSDDRYLNSFSNRDGIRIVGTNDILFTLLNMGLIADNEYFAVLNRMRASNLQFIPLSADEICYFLFQTKYDDSGLIVSQELKEIVSYASRALNAAKFLQKPSANLPNQFGEFPFLLQHVHTSLDVLEKIWENLDLNITEKQLFSNWVFDNLYVDYVALTNLLEYRRTSENLNYLASLKLMGLLFRGLSLPSRNKVKSESVRGQYFDWLAGRFLGPEINFNSDLLETSSILLKQTILENKLTEEKELSKKTLSLIYQNFCLELPEPIRTNLEKDDIFMSAIGVQFLITVGKYQFDLDEFWNAISRVANTGKAIINPKNHKVRISLSLNPTDTDRGTLIMNVENEKSQLISVPEYEVLKSNKKSLVDFLKKKQALFDWSNKELRGVLEKILFASTPRAKIDCFVEAQKTSMKVRYSNLQEQLLTKRNFTIEDLLPPHVSEITRYFHINLNNQDPFSKTWEVGVKSLLKSQGIDETLLRLFGAPVAIPETFFAHFEKLSIEKQRKLIKSLLHDVQSPISILHLIKVIGRLGKNNRSYQRLALQKIKYLLTIEFELELKVFITIMNWVTGNLCMEEGKNVPARLLTIWLHSHMLYKIIKNAGGTTDWIEKYFSQKQISLACLFEIEQNIQDDVAFPHNLTNHSFVLSGITYSASELIKELTDEFKVNLANICLIKTDDRILPNPFLMDDMTLLSDNLNSLWSGDRGEKLSSFLGNELSVFLSSENAYGLLQETIEKMDDHINSNSLWVDLFAITRGKCVPAPLKEKLEENLCKVDFYSLFDKDLELGCLALHLASIFVPTLKSERYTDHIIDQLSEIPRKFNILYPEKDFKAKNDDEEKNLRNIVGILLEVTYNISKLKATSEERVIEFTKLNKKVIETWGYYALHVKPVFQALCEKLPAEQSRHIWNILITLRIL